MAHLRKGGALIKIGPPFFLTLFQTLVGISDYLNSVPSENAIDSANLRSSRSDRAPYPNALTQRLWPVDGT